jgi:hypothetical protein
VQYTLAADLAAVLVSVPVWTRDNAYLDAPDTRPSFFGNALLRQRRIAPPTWLAKQLARPTTDGPRFFPERAR